jgi:N6-L-threonylcarbamoyladenine synthase
MKGPLVFALESSCDETAAAVCDGHGHVIASVVASQIAEHRPYGGVVPELASRNHTARIRPLIQECLSRAHVSLAEIACFAATAGPGLASSLLIGNTVAKALAHSVPFLAVNHLEGHLLSPFVGRREAISPHIALIVSGGHTLLVHVRGLGDYAVLGRTRDDAAGEAFDKVARMLGLPYPGGPQIDRHARHGDAAAFDFPRSMLDRPDHDFSFSGLKTSARYLLRDLGDAAPARLADVCASFQEAVVDVLVTKSLRAARALGVKTISISGGVSCNARLREAATRACEKARVTLELTAPDLSTDNAGMIAFAALHRFMAGHHSPLTADVDPNLKLASYA